MSDSTCPTGVVGDSDWRRCTPSTHFFGSDRYANPALLSSRPLIRPLLSVLCPLASCPCEEMPKAKQKTVTEMEDSSPEVSPRRSWRTSSRPLQEPPASQHGSSRQSSHRSRRSAAPRVLQDLQILDTPPARPVDARRRSAPPVAARARPTPPDSGRERSPLATSRHTVAPSPGDLRDLLDRRAVTPSPQRLPPPSLQRTPIIPLMNIDTRAVAPATASQTATKTHAPPRSVAPGARRDRVPQHSPSPQPSTSTGVQRPPQIGSSESTLTAPSPGPQYRRPRSPSPEVIMMGPPPPRRGRSPEAPPKRQRGAPQAPPPRTPPRLVNEPLQLPRTPGHFSSPESDPGLDLTRVPRAQYVETDVDDNSQWDQFSTTTEAPAPLPQQPIEDKTPFSWAHVVDLVYRSGMVDTTALPPSPEPVKSVIGGPQAPTKKKLALPHPPWRQPVCQQP